MVALKPFAKPGGAEDLQQFINKPCIFGESSTFMIARATSFTQDGTWIYCTVQPESEVHFNRHKKEFYSEPPLAMDLALNRDGGGSITIQGDPSGDCFLAFRFGYFTSRFFYLDEIIHSFREQDDTWFERLARNYIF